MIKTDAERERERERERLENLCEHDDDDDDDDLVSLFNDIIITMVYLMLKPSF